MPPVVPRLSAKPEMTRAPEPRSWLFPQMFPKELTEPVLELVRKDVNPLLSFVPCSWNSHDPEMLKSLARVVFGDQNEAPFTIKTPEVH